ncbi:DUF6705 family protein [Flavobacterium sp. HTF]|uniref:DUF6705 family protein n=1 Tax=Flavobacterium sp. HTF TaxID=2170732 RepID=UPI000D5E411A|nr:DUF6705 family protein [Flavobacterium sp. HTF]PWB23083.1 hypothetical protein DCO46_15430 [Flavobacterium sp. HTF]
MKTIRMIISLILVCLSCEAQQIIPVEKMIEYRDSDTQIPDGAYLKDINGLLDKYLGTWKGTYENKNYTFIITKVKHKLINISSDELFIRYLITTTTGSILEDTRNLPDTNPLVIEGDYISNNKAYYVLNYFGKNTKCGQSGEVFISTLASKSNKQMKLFLAPYQDIIDRNVCPVLAQQILPTKSMYLTKQ